MRLYILPNTIKGLNQHPLVELLMDKVNEQALDLLARESLHKNATFHLYISESPSKLKEPELYLEITLSRFYYTHISKLEVLKEDSNTLVYSKTFSSESYKITLITFTKKTQV
jgi:hypothetical protein